VSQAGLPHSPRNLAPIVPCFPCICGGFFTASERSEESLMPNGGAKEDSIAKGRKRRTVAQKRRRDVPTGQWWSLRIDYSRRLVL